jgi:hypothetical protein
MTSREFTESLVYERLEPDTGEETVRLLGLLTMLMFNVHRDKQVKPEPFDFEEFVPDPYGIPRAERIAAYRQYEAQMRTAMRERKAAKERTH